MEYLDALILDFDQDAPDWDVLELAGITFLAHSTYSHWLADARHPVPGPHWRLVLPLAAPIPAARWRAIYARARVLFPQADPACCDPARMQRWPSCPLAPPAPPEVRVSDTGYWLDPDSLPPLPVRPRPPRPVWPLQARGSVAAPGTDWRRVADAFDRRASIVDLLVRDGWTDLGQHGDRVHLGRPGKDYTLPDTRCSATADYGGNNLVHVFSSNAPPLEAGGTYGPFRYLSLVQYGGDAQRAVEDLRRQGYGR